MSTISLSHFDALGYVEKSTKLGVNEDVARFQARELESVFDMAVAKANQHLDKELNTVATKLDIQELKSELRSEMKALRFELLRWVVGVGVTTIIAISGIMFTLLKLMH